jgi:MFS family permease
MSHEVECVVLATPSSGEEVLNDSSDKQPSRSRLPIEFPAMLCTFADYLGLVTVTATLPFHLDAIGVLAVADWSGRILSAQFAAVVLGNPLWGVVADKVVLWWWSRRAEPATPRNTVSPPSLKICQCS